MKLFITIDCEEDGWASYKRYENSVENAYIIPRLQSIFHNFNAKPTYLVNYPVITDHRAREILADIHRSGRCEIGTHCHPWNTPPFDEEINPRNSMLCNLPFDLVSSKLENLHLKIAEAIGEAPISFRAGRWGLGPDVARCILSLDYKVDTSVTPFVDWRPDHGPDFSAAPVNIYRFDPDNILLTKSEGSLLEVPATIGFFQKNQDLSARLRKRILGTGLARLRVLGLLDRLDLLNFCWLSPEMASGRQMIAFARSCLRKGYKYLNMSFHSTSLLPGKGPFLRNSGELERFLGDIEMFLEFAVGQGIESCPLRDGLHL